MEITEVIAAVEPGSRLQRYCGIVQLAMYLASLFGFADFVDVDGVLHGTGFNPDHLRGLPAFDRELV